MNSFFTILMGFAMLSVLGVLAIGIVSMVKGGEFNEKYGNKLMRARVILQGAAIGFLALAYISNQ